MAGWSARTDNVRHGGHLQGGPDDNEQIDLRAILKQCPVELVAKFLAEERDVRLCIVIASSATSRATGLRRHSPS